MVLALHDRGLMGIMSAALSVALEDGPITPDGTAYTVIAPTDRAFAKATEDGSILCTNSRACASENEFLFSSGVEEFVLRHVFRGYLFPELWTDGQILRSVNGAYSKVENLDGGAITIGGAHLAQKNSRIAAADGVILVVDSVLKDYSRLDPSAVASAERIADVGPFSDGQYRVLVNELTSYVTCYRKIRGLGFRDWESRQQSALVFSPLLSKPSEPEGVGGCEEGHSRIGGDPALKGLRRQMFVAPPSGKAQEWSNGVFWTIPLDVERPDSDDDLAYMTVMQLASLLRQKKVTSKELTALYLDRLKRYDDTLEAVVTFTDSLAMSQAAQADHEMEAGVFRGPLHGIPYGLKDLMAVPNYPTTWGAELFSNQVLNEACWPYKQLLSSGAVLVAKLATGAMAWGDVWFNGRTKNPWNIAEGSCGSSSGSGAATSAGLVPFAIGTETWGSMSCPSETMGVTGYRPTFGTVGRTGVMSLAPSLDKIGAFCREATDCAIIVNAMRGKDPEDMSSVIAPPIDPQDVAVEDMRIGYIKEADTQVVREMAHLGAQMVPVTLNFSVPASDVVNIILASEAGAYFDQWLRSDASNTMREQHKWPDYIRSARFIPAVEYIQANRARVGLMKEVSAKLAGLDAVLVPARLQGNQNGVGNGVGTPQVVFPVGFEPVAAKEGRASKRKDPKVQALIGLPYSDAKLLAIVSAYQTATTYHLRRPPIDDVEEDVRDLCLPYSRCSQKNDREDVSDDDAGDLADIADNL
eukprot:evm.model.scf_171.2 EVM.evm.TU.scf_171.2   scf_171:9813-21952(+)